MKTATIAVLTAFALTSSLSFAPAQAKHKHHHHHKHQMSGANGPSGPGAELGTADKSRAGGKGVNDKPGT